MTKALPELREDLRALVEEREQELAALRDALAVLSGNGVAAPFGYKADGSPRKRPAPSRATMAKSIATRRAGTAA